MIYGKEKLLECLFEHLSSVLNRSSTINEESIARLTQVQVDNTLEDPPTGKVTDDNKRLSSGNAPGADSIPVEVSVFVCQN